ncbi:MAG: hypothetical protein QN148_08820, partial [Armatimonadota bacterium]|nr:hypothetical protein [Armatimonadota bacterium]
SAAGTKLPNYVLAFYPLAAVATGAALDAFWDRPGKLRWGFAALAGLWVLFCAAVAAYGLWLYPAESRAVFPVVAVPLLVFGAGVLGGAAFGLRGNTGAAVTALASGAVAFFLLLAWQVMPEVDRHRPHREVAHAAAAWTRGDEVRVAYWVPNSLVFYSGRTWRAYLDPEPVRREVCAAGARRVVLVAPQARLQELRPAVDGFRTLQELRGWKVLEKPEGRVVRCP